MKKQMLLLVLTILTLGCSNDSLRGEYVAQGASVIDTFRFLNRGRVEISNMVKTSMGTYERDGNKITVTANGDTIVFMLINDGDCLDSGGMLGIYCKN